MSNRQIIDVDQLEKLEKCPEIVLVGGCFDVLHLGHAIFLEKAKKTGKTLVVLLECDESIRKLKGENRPINKQKDRAEMLAKLKMVDWVVILPEFKTNDEYGRLIKKIKPKVIAITQGDEKTEIKKIEAEKAEAKLILVSKRLNNYSSSKIIEQKRLKKRDATINPSENN